jgi:acetyltransferase-like isoleucine patch superfamily enzyme/glycosyltransferase involved in cell wall biosynthesis
MTLVEQQLSAYKGNIELKILHHEQNKGLSGARNTGTHASTGDYIYYLDSDDEITPACIETLVALIEKYPNVEMVQGNMQTIPEPPKKSDWRNISYKNFPEYVDDNKWIREHYLSKPMQSIPVNAWNKLLKRDFIFEHKLFFKEGIIHEDVYWMFWLVKNLKTIAFTTKYSYLHYITEGSIMQSENNYASLNSYYFILKEIYNNDGLGNTVNQKNFFLQMLDSNIKKIKDKELTYKYISLVKYILKKELKNRSRFAYSLFPDLLILYKKSKTNIKKVLFNYIKAEIRKKKVNYFLTVYLNIKMLPMSQAIKMPIYVYGWPIMRMDGKIVINSNIIVRGMIKLGNDPVSFIVAKRSKLSISEDAKIVFYGRANFNQGFSVNVRHKGILEISNRASIGDNVMVLCFKHIFIGERVHLTWESQVMDSNFHYIEHLDRQYITDICKPIHIGNYCWIGNRTTIMPGTVLPDRTIVASNSLLNKDYIAQGIGSYSLIGGMPAKLLTTNVKRIYSVENEFFLADYILNHNKEKVPSSLLPAKEIN